MMPPPPAAAAGKDIDEIRELRLQLLNYENAILREKAERLDHQVLDMTKKINELEASFDLVGEMLVQCIKHLQSSDAKTVVSHILATVAKVHDAEPPPPAPTTQAASSCSQLSSSESDHAVTPPPPRITAPAVLTPPALSPTTTVAKPKIPQLSLAHVEPSAWLHGEPTAGDVYRE